MMEREEMNKQIEAWNRQFENAEPGEVLIYFLEHFKGRIALSSSMGAEDQVLTAMVSGLDPSVTIFTLDTGRLFPETYELIEETNKHFDIRLKVYFPDREAVEKMVGEKGINLFLESVENRKLCCGIRKVEPSKRALKELDVWICGLRKDQSVERFFNKLVEWDEANGLIKLNPLINWTEKQVWDYIRENNIPYNILHDKGFPSIGCQPCTRAVEPGEDIRAGRWWWEDSEKRECGLHRP